MCSRLQLVLLFLMKLENWEKTSAHLPVLMKVSGVVVAVIKLSKHEDGVQLGVGQRINLVSGKGRAAQVRRHVLIKPGSRSTRLTSHLLKEQFLFSLSFFSPLRFFFLSFSSVT